MATKREEIESGCLSKTDDDDLVFVLLDRDKLAASTIRYWAAIAHRHGVPLEKIKKAEALADRMEQRVDRRLPD